LSRVASGGVRVNWVLSAHQLLTEYCCVVRIRRSLSPSVRQSSSSSSSASSSTSRQQSGTVAPTSLPPPPPLVRFVGRPDERGSRRRRGAGPTGRRRNDHATGGGKVGGGGGGGRRRSDQSLEEHDAPRRPIFQLVAGVPSVSSIPRLHSERPHVAVFADAEVEASAPTAASAGGGGSAGGRGRGRRRLGVLPAVVDVVQARHRVVSECTFTQLTARTPLKRTPQ